jgi:hypothetical protein
MAVWADVLSRHARLVRVLLASGLVAVLGSILMWGPAGLPFSHCLFRELTGLSCLTCGLTRSLQAASHGHLQAAFQFHLLGPFMLAGVVMLLLACVTEALTGRRLISLPRARNQRYVCFGVLAVWVVYGVGRMIVELT